MFQVKNNINTKVEVIKYNVSGSLYRHGLVLESGSHSAAELS